MSKLEIKMGKGAMGHNLTPGKWYSVEKYQPKISPTGRLFTIQDDGGCMIGTNEFGSVHLNLGDWEVREVKDV